MGEHIDGLVCHNLILLVHELEVTGLSGRIAADIYYPAGRSMQDGINHISMHSCSGGIGYNHVGTAIALYEIGRQHVLHITCQELGVIDTIERSVDTSILNGFSHILYAYNLASLTGTSSFPVSPAN